MWQVWASTNGDRPMITDEAPPETCPKCKEPDVYTQSIVDNRRHYRCPECLWSWHKRADQT